MLRILIFIADNGWYFMAAGLLIMLGIAAYQEAS